MSKSVSSSIKQLLQKYGDKLKNGSMSREQIAKAVEDLAKQSRSSVDRNWGDQSKDGKQGPKK